MNIQFKYLFCSTPEQPEEEGGHVNSVQLVVLAR